MKWKIYGDKDFLRQWDINQKIILIEAPDNIEIHFSHYGDEEAIVCAVHNENNMTYVNVPNILLQQGEMLYMYTVQTDGNIQSTIQTNTINVVEREKPSDYVYEETEIILLSNVLKEALDAITKIVPSKISSFENDKNYQTASDIANILKGMMKVVTANNDSEAEALLADISSNLVSYSPVLLLVTYDGSETIGLNTGDGYMIIDSGTGSIDDAYIIPHIVSEVNFSSDDKSKLDNAEKFITDYPQSVLWKSIPHSTLNSVTRYTDGTSMNTMPLREFIASINIDFSEGATVPSSGSLTVCTYSLSERGTMAFGVDQDIMDLGSILLKIHGIVVENCGLITFSIFKDGSLIFEDERSIDVLDTDLTTKKGSTSFYLYAKSDSYATKTVNYVYGRS